MMHTTTVRFGTQSWTTLKARAERDGVAVAQYIREATLMRVAADQTTERLGREYFEALVRDLFSHAFTKVHRRLLRLEHAHAGGPRRGD